MAFFALINYSLCKINESMVHLMIQDWGNYSSSEKISILGHAHNSGAIFISSSSI